MSTVIAVAGKGGSGKTTFAALVIEALSRLGTVLAVDADPSTNLHLSLGLPAPESIGDAREELLAEIKAGRFGAGLSKGQYLAMRVQEAVVESRGVDLLAMGRPEGPGCYCAVNHLL